MMSQSPISNSTEDIAIIGMSGRFPGATGIEMFWQNLRDGVESITPFSSEELEALGVAPAMLKHPAFVKVGALIDDVEMFDAAFFGINPHEAEILDPQQRIALECAWEALESAGYDPERFPGLIGVYASGSPSAYFLYNLYPNTELRALVGNFQLTLNNDREFLPTRISYKLNLKGPSVNVQTACSSSLVSLHLACQSLLNYQCDMALAGGVSVRMLKGGYLYQEGGILSPDGHCRAFDARAQGTVFGSGVGMVVVKRLDDALADGDHIYAVVKSSAINNDGSAKIGYTAPSADGQAKVIAEALAIGRIDPESISYIEAHGTGTSLGDPIEVAALTDVFRTKTSKKGFCALGTVKTNVGHLDAAAGVTGIIKTALALKSGLIPPSLHFEQANPQIDFQNSPFYVNTQLSEWKSDGTPRRAGVSSFGIGGTNAHAVLEEAPPRADSGESRQSQLLLLSAKSSASLEAATVNLVAYLKQNPEAKLADVAYTLQVGRGMFHHRRMLVSRSAEETVAALETLAPRVVFTSSVEARYRPVVFMFSGQGSQYVNMALGLYQGEPDFRKQVDLCCEILQTPLGFDLRQVLYPREDQVEEATQRLNQTFITQPALFVIEYALACLWIEWGIRPETMIGHSIGEYVAACLASVFSLEEALALVASRGRLMQEMPAGAMLTVPLSEKEIGPWLDGTLSLAAINGPSLCVVSGPVRHVETLQQKLSAQGVASRSLHTSHAFHSDMMEPILEPFMKLVQRVTLRPPQIPYISNLTGTWITEAEATDPVYWAQHLRYGVRFADGLQELLKVQDRILLEVGPGRTLSTLARQHPKRAAGQPTLSSVRHPQQAERPDADFLLDSMGQLWLAGATVDWAGYYAGEKRHRISLPTYPFDHRRYWIDEVKEGATSRTHGGPLVKKPEIADWFYLPSWTRSAPLGLLKRTGAAESPSCWLVFSDSCGLGKRLVERLEQAGEDVITVMPGKEFAAINERSYTIGPGQVEDYKTLLKELHAREKKPAKIAHLWSITTHNPALARMDSLDEMQALGFYSLLFLAQAIGNQGLTDPLHIGIVSNHLQEVVVGDDLCPQKATLLGPCKVIPREYSNVTCRSIDVVTPESASQLELLIDQLLCEFAADSSDSIIAYRGDYRWVQNFEAVPLNPISNTDVPLRQRGVYLITGGLGGLGLTFAEHLSQTVQAKLVLVSRSTFPNRAEWTAWEATHDQEERVGQTIRQLLHLEALGSEVMVVTADTANQEQMREVIDQIRQRFGGLHGVIHAAGVPGGGLIQFKTSEAARAVQSPKLEGVLVLDSLLAGQSLDFFVLCSSLTSVLGAIGQVDYCAANAFLDAFALYKTRRDGLFTVAVNWDAWGDVGMAVKAAGTLGSPLKPQPLPPPIAVHENGHHPLFDSYALEADEEIYTSRLSAPTHWVLDEHRIMGRPTLVGTTYLEMARAACQKHAPDGTMVVKDVIFIAPMMLAVSETKEVQTVIRKAGDAFDFTVRSRVSANGNGQPQWQDHAFGTVVCAEPKPSKKHSLPEIMERCCVDEITVAVRPDSSGPGSERLAHHGPMSFGPRWANLRKVYVGHNEGLAVLELPDEFGADLGEFWLHPALMDLATSFAISKLRGDGFYLPFSYKRLTVSGPLRRRIYSHARYNDDVSDTREVIELDIVITDEDGVELVEIEGFTMKRIGDRATQALAAKGSVEGNGHGALAGGQTRTGGLNLKDAILPLEGVEAFHRILSNRRLSQVIVSTMDLPLRAEQSRASSSSTLLEKLEKRDQASQTMHPRPDVRTAYAAPTNELEEAVAEIWQRVLGIERIGLHDDFIELGGHSLLAIQVLKHMEEAFPVHLPAETIFKAPTVASLAEAILVAMAEQSDGERLTQILEGVEQMSGD